MERDPPLLRRTILLAGLTFGVVSPAQATFGPGGPPDEAFRRDALATGAVALRTSLAARARSPNPDVRRFAASEIAEQRGLSARLGGPAPLGPRGAALVAEGEAAPPGLAFDRVYVAGQLDGHRRLLAVDESYARFGRDPYLADVAAGALPLIRTHLAVLRNLRASLA